MKRTSPLGICGISRDQLTAAGVTRPAVTLDVVRLWAKMGNCAQVIATTEEPSRVLIITPGGSTLGTSGKPMGFVEAEEFAWGMAARMGWADPVVRMAERVGC